METVCAIACVLGSTDLLRQIFGYQLGLPLHYRASIARVDVPWLLRLFATSSHPRSPAIVLAQLEWADELWAACATALLATTHNAVHNIQWRVAASFGHLHLLRYLAEHDASHYTPEVLHNAAWSGHVDVICFLHEIGAALDYASFAHACVQCHVPVAEYLWQHEPALHVLPPFLVQRVAEKGHLPVLAFLFDRFGGVGFTHGAMESAAQAGHLDAMRFVQEHIINPNHTYSMHLCLYLAATKNHVDIVAYLVHEFPEMSVATVILDAVASGCADVACYLVAQRPTAVPLRRLHREAKKWVRANEPPIEQRQQLLEFLDTAIRTRKISNARKSCVAQ
ncbi:hypothetical protein SDRG_08097 [Saprolegnia diclina VS20]|uniref:Uncharacterized protein n=1 Tax=Saprolegnia diclina (strain VS20) TaxID=1156394 RepID=T0Q8V0_SAPDV|nr:hypothetical protein SDRG_08097 [Saprolegnia diclina VS20]EQC34324.1 hypothetical protein SDRG_08097 [Saprolegnia diclina VS20]|eukprot:XP_008612186.1 hypothetical protein SDRG_08097 [Saprolegnia diclina VS20]